MKSSFCEKLPAYIKSSNSKASFSVNIFNSQILTSVEFNAYRSPQDWKKLISDEFKKKKIEETMEQENYIKISVEEKRLLKFDEKYIFYDKEFYTRSNPLIVDLQKL